MPAPWERQPGESDPAWEAFVAYRDGQPDASTRSVARQLSKSAALIARWSSRHEWQSRIRAWALEVDRQQRDALLAHGRERAKRHAEVAAAALEILMRPGLALAAKLQQDRDLLQRMDPDRLARLSVQASKAIPQLIVAERLSLGLSTENLAVDDARRQDGTAAAGVASDADLDRELLGVDTGASSEVVEGEAREMLLEQETARR